MIYQWNCRGQQQQKKTNTTLVIDLLSAIRFILTWLNWAAAAAAWKFFVTKSSDDTGKYGAGGVL